MHSHCIVTIYRIYFIYEIMLPSGGTPALAAAPLDGGSFGAKSNTFPYTREPCGMRQHKAPLVFYRSGSNTDAQCTIWAKAPLTQPTANGSTKVVDLGGWVVVVVVGHEPVHDSLHVTYRLLAPGTEPSRGPQPINISLYIM